MHESYLVLQAKNLMGYRSYFYAGTEVSMAPKRGKYDTEVAIVKVTEETEHQIRARTQQNRYASGMIGATLFRTEAEALDYFDLQAVWVMDDEPKLVEANICPGCEHHMKEHGLMMGCLVGWAVGEMGPACPCMVNQGER